MKVSDAKQRPRFLKTDFLALSFLILFTAGFFLLPLFDIHPSRVYLFLGFLAIVAADLALRKLSLSVAASVQVFIFFALFLGSCAGFYAKFTFYDLCIHFISGILLALTAREIWNVLTWRIFFPCEDVKPRQDSSSAQEKNAQEDFAARKKENFYSSPVQKRHCLLGTAFCFLFACAGAGLWEVWEFLGDTFFGFNGQVGSLFDTMTDIIAGALGGALGASFALFPGK